MVHLLRRPWLRRYSVPVGAGGLFAASAVFSLTVRLRQLIVTPATGVLGWCRRWKVGRSHSQTSIMPLWNQEARRLSGGAGMGRLQRSHRRTTTPSHSRPEYSRQVRN
jgi:hypothetical protein